MEYYWLWGLILPIWVMCGVVGWSMYAGTWRAKYNESFTIWVWQTSKINALWGMFLAGMSGPAIILVVIQKGWTKKDGMWL